MTAGGYGDPPRRMRGREARRAAARSAQDSAIQGFYRMDRLQRDVGVQVEAYANVSVDQQAAVRLRQEYAALCADADNRAHRYLATLDAHPLDRELSANALDAAVHAYTAAATDIGAMAGKIEAFAARNAGYFGQVGAMLDRIAGHTREAAAELARARAAAGALAEAGSSSAAVDAALAEAESAAAELARGPAAHGVQGMFALADRVRDAAARAGALAEDLPRRRAEVTTRLRSIRTRREAVAHQADGIAEVLRALRRAYVEGCWADLSDVGERVAAALAASDTELALAETAARAAEWDAAAAALALAVARLDAAARLVAEARARPAALDEARRDPAARVRAARLALRDAQRLVMAGRSLPPAPWAGELDALAARLDRAEGMLAGVHPDY